jgi:outer membrane protein assembly factor BamB
MGGVAVTPRGFLYAATYNWDTTSGENNSTLIKVDVTDGRIAWTVPVERTNTTPVVVGEALYVSAGIVGPYGSRPKVQCFRDTGQGAERVWETGAGLNVGGWTSQPVYAWGKLYVGAQDEAYGVDWRPNGQGYLYILDLTKDPHDPAFVLASVKGVGNSPVVTHNSVYSVGPKAVARFHEPLFLADINGDGTVNELDRQGILDVMGQGYPLGTIRTDLDLDGDVDQADLEILEAERVGIESREHGYDEAAI